MVTVLQKTESKGERSLMREAIMNITVQEQHFPRLYPALRAN